MLRSRGLALALGTCLLAVVPACGKTGAAGAGKTESKAVVSARPGIVCDQPTVDLGPVAEGAEATHVFKVRNQGDQPLKLIRAQGG